VTTSSRAVPLWFAALRALRCAVRTSSDDNPAWITLAEADGRLTTVPSAAKGVPLIRAAARCLAIRYLGGDAPALSGRCRVPDVVIGAPRSDSLTVKRRRYESDRR
jgi:hypothetical protein